jgi:mannose-6-phosphate isomerase-like protein (cupin superfamily)
MGPFRIAALLVCVGSAVLAQDSLAGNFHLSKARGPLRQVDLSPFKEEVSSEILAGPTNGLDVAYIVYTRLAAGARKKGLYTLPVDHTFLVLAGKMNVQLGTDEFVVGPETLVLVPAGAPHQIWNAGSEPVAEFEVITPDPARDLASMVKPAQPRKIENAVQYVRVAPPLEKLAGGINERILADKSTGSPNVLERLNAVLTGGGRTGPHYHPFDQLYFIQKGTMTVLYGTATYQAGPNTLVAIPRGVIHNNTNEAPEPNSYVTLLVPDIMPRGGPLQIGGGGGQGAGRAAKGKAQ